MSDPDTRDLKKLSLHNSDLKNSDSNSADLNSADSNGADPNKPVLSGGDPGQVHGSDCVGGDWAPPLPSPQASKAAWRDWARLRRSQLPAPDSEAICEHLLAFLAGRGVDHVLAYHALPGEPDVSALAAQLHLSTTRAVFRPEMRLTLHDWHSATDTSRSGIRQPPRGTPEVERTRIGAVLLPGLAFDETGTRLGYGGGFYDRLLRGWEVLSIGVTAQGALLPGSTLPREAHDQSVGHLATELGVRQIESQS